MREGGLPGFNDASIWHETTKPSLTLQEQEIANYRLKNPWLKKNPWMSMWLSAANHAAGSVRGRATAQAKRQVATISKTATTEAVRLWTSALTGSKPARKGRRRRGSS